jgi:hypothetical protein
LAEEVFGLSIAPFGSFQLTQLDQGGSQQNGAIGVLASGLDGRAEGLLGCPSVPARMGKPRRVYVMLVSGSLVGHRGGRAWQERSGERPLHGLARREAPFA